MKIIFRRRQEERDQEGQGDLETSNIKGNERFKLSERASLLVVSCQSVPVHSLVFCAIPLVTQVSLRESQARIKPL